MNVVLRDNTVAESFFSILECEHLSRRPFSSQAEGRVACFADIGDFHLKGLGKSFAR